MGGMAGGERSVVVIEDDAHIADLLDLYLREAGFRVLQAATGERGLALIAQHRPAIALLDIGLPDIDGVEVAQRITAAADGNAPVVVLISSRDGDGCEAVFAGCGARGFIPKAELSGDAITALAA